MTQDKRGSASTKAVCLDGVCENEITVWLRLLTRGGEINPLLSVDAMDRGTSTASMMMRARSCKKADKEIKGNFFLLLFFFNLQNLVGYLSIFVFFFIIIIYL